MALFVGLHLQFSRGRVLGGVDELLTIMTQKILGAAPECRSMYPHRIQKCAVVEKPGQ